MFSCPPIMPHPGGDFSAGWCDSEHLKTLFAGSRPHSWGEERRCGRIVDAEPVDRVRVGPSEAAWPALWLGRRGDGYLCPWLGVGWVFSVGGVLLVFWVLGAWGLSAWRCGCGTGSFSGGWCSCAGCCDCGGVEVAVDGGVECS